MSAIKGKVVITTIKKSVIKQKVQRLLSKMPQYKILVEVQNKFHRPVVDIVREHLKLDDYVSKPWLHRIAVAVPKKPLCSVSDRLVDNVIPYEPQGISENDGLWGKSYQRTDDEERELRRDLKNKVKDKDLPYHRDNIALAMFLAAIDSKIDNLHRQREAPELTFDVDEWVRRRRIFYREIINWRIGLDLGRLAGNTKDFISRASFNNLFRYRNRPRKRFSKV